MLSPLLPSSLTVPTTPSPMTTFKLKRAATPPPPPHNDILFPSLPPELRSIIYSYALSHPSTITISAADAIYNGPLRHPYYLPHLCRVNKATRIDVGLWFLRTTEFGLLYAQDIVYFVRFLSSFPGNAGFASIRRLDFQLFGRNIPQVKDGVRERNTYIEFMKLCTGLTQVRIKFEMQYRLSKRGTSSYWGPSTELSSVEDIDETFRLEDLFELKELTKIVVEVWPKTLRHMSPSRRHLTLDPWSVMEKVVEWMKEGWEERGRKVRIELVESVNSGLRWAGGSEMKVL